MNTPVHIFVETPAARWDGVDDSPLNRAIQKFNERFRYEFTASGLRAAGQIASTVVMMASLARAGGRADLATELENAYAQERNR